MKKTSAYNQHRCSWWWQRSNFQLLALALGVGIIAGFSSTADAWEWKSLFGDGSQSCPVKAAQLNESDLEVAQVAWQYFERNTQAETGLVNAVDQYPSTTMWDTGSTLAAILSAHHAGLILSDEFRDRVEKLLRTLAEFDLFNGEGPNKVYHTVSGQMVDYRNQPSIAGIGVSTLDLGRLVSWLNILACLHPEYANQAAAVIERWSFCRLIDKGQMYGLARDTASGSAVVLQEGRLGYEQYAGKALGLLGFDLRVASRYKNRHATETKIYDIPILVDKRDSATLGAYNYVVAESYAMDRLEHGDDDDDEIQSLFENIFKVQQQRYIRTGKVTAVSEDNIDQPPYFVYNTIYTDGRPWYALTDRGEDVEELKTLSTKAALSMAYLKPDAEYSETLKQTVWQARNPAGGWYSGIYEKDGRYNKATTANTNGVVLSLMLHKMYGALNSVCENCDSGIKLRQEFLVRAGNSRTCKKELPQRVQSAKQIAAERAVDRLKQQRLLVVQKTRKIITKIADAQSEYIQGGRAKAVEFLSGAKSLTWSLSEELKSERDVLRRLMSDYDNVKKAWLAGKNSVSVEKIESVLNGLLNRREVILQGTLGDVQ